VMKDPLPSAQDIKKIVFKVQRQKNLLPEHAVLTSALNDEVLLLRSQLATENKESERIALDMRLNHALQRKRKLEEKKFEELALELRNYIVDQPKVIRLSKYERDGRVLMTFNKRRGTVTLFDRYVALLLSRAFRTRLYGRDQLIRSLLNALQITVRKTNNKAHRSVIRLDIKNFFGSIDHEILRSKLRSHAGVPLFSLRHVDSLLNSCTRITGKQVGIPQGVPSSSILAEIYLEKLDRNLKQNSFVVFYARYVDDIIVICHGSAAKQVDIEIQKTLDELKLVRNEDKSSIHYYPAGNSDGFDYLGYGFDFNEVSGQLSSLDISEKKYDRYEAALNSLVNHLAKVTCGQKKAEIDLLLEATSYLFLPRATVADSDSLRIVTGLAYSSRFLLHVNAKAPRINKLMNLATQFLDSGLSWLPQAGISQSPKCHCCGVPVHRYGELLTLKTTKIDRKLVLNSQAVSHSDDPTRRKVAELLWKLHVAK